MRSSNFQKSGSEEKQESKKNRELKKYEKFDLVLAIEDWFDSQEEEELGSIFCILDLILFF